MAAIEVLNDALGWRETCLVWAALNLPSPSVNRLVLPLPAASAGLHAARPSVGWKPYKQCCFSLSSLRRPGLSLERWQRICRACSNALATPVQAVAAAALVGPAQVVARLAEFLTVRRIHPLVSARIAALLYPIGAAALAIAGPSGAAVFAVFYGAGNGLLTIARGTVPLVMFGPHAFGERTGLLGAPARAAQAFAPLVFGLLLDAMGVSAILVSVGLYLAALGALLCLRAT